MSQMKKKWFSGFWARCLLFAVLLYVMDFAIGSLLRIYYFKQSSGLLYRTTYALDSTRAEVLIFGSSTANHQYIPSDFQKTLGLSTYNTGRDGNSIFYHYAVLKSVLRRYTPKIIILDFNERDFEKDQSSYDRLSALLPYYGSNPDLRPIILLKSPYEKFKLISHIYPYNSLLFTIAAGNARFNKDRDDIKDQNGYVPLDKTWQSPIIDDTIQSKYTLDQTKISIFKSFIKDCQAAHIKLYIFISPPYVKFKYQDPSINLAKDIAMQDHIPFIDYTNDPQFLAHREYYADAGHLNAVGASVYTGIVLDTIESQKWQAYNLPLSFSKKRD